MRPILIDFGFFELPTYGVLLVIGYFLATWQLKPILKTLKLPEKKVLDLTVFALLVGLLGAKLLLILVDLGYYLENPKEILGTIRAAGVLYGGVILGGLAAGIFIKVKKLPALDVLDAICTVLPLGIAIGRLGCLAAGCCYGVHYDGPLAIQFGPHPYCEAEPFVDLFPIQIVAFLNGLLLFFVLRHFMRKRAFKGQIFALFLMLYAVARFLLELGRGDTVRGLWFGDLISTSQLISIGMLLLGTGFFFKFRKQAQND